MAIHATAGRRAFWAFHDAIFESEERLSDELLERAAARAGFARGELATIARRVRAAEKVAADMELAEAVGVRGTPAFFVNGVSIPGAQPIERFREVIDAELAAARELAAAGTPPERVWAQRTTKSLEVPRAPGDAPPAPKEDDRTEHLVPIAGSPTRGDATALVTIVSFTDFQCPFCARAVPTVEQILTEYRGKVRYVLKHNPLPFHARAEPAAELALEARAQKGDAAFWEVHDRLFASSQHLEDADLEGIARDVGLDATRAMKAVAARKHAAVIARDMDLAEDATATGTPTFFLNGRKLVGAQPIERFRSIIDEELARAQKLVAAGTPAAKIYETLQKQAKAPEPPAKVTLPAPTAANPSKGPARAKVTVHVFSDYECPFCKRVEDTLGELDRSFPGQLRFVWHAFPLSSSHAHADGAAAAALEAYRQKGAAGFWKMHAQLFDHQDGGLGRAELSSYAASVGLDVKRFDAAIEGGEHAAAIAADKKVGEAAGVTGTPTTVINGYVVSGAQPLRAFEKAVRRALAEAK
jgi:protein-disulfide isomerase